MLSEKEITRNLEECREFINGHDKFLLVRFDQNVGNDHERFTLNDLNDFLRANRYGGPIIFNEETEYQYLLIDIIHLQMRCLWSNIEEFKERSLLGRIWDFQEFVILHTKFRGPFFNSITRTLPDGSKRTVILEAEGYYDKAFIFSYITPKDHKTNKQ
ncbi:MAG: hypothetical protein IJJ00_04520 [Erysipelotrichaceae bacterium]|nr:hypothetical protein [Erysipelotrichaceae bacterium]